MKIFSVLKISLAILLLCSQSRADNHVSAYVPVINKDAGNPVWLSENLDDMYNHSLISETPGSFLGVAQQSGLSRIGFPDNLTSRSWQPGRHILMESGGIALASGIATSILRVHDEIRIRFVPQRSGMYRVGFDAIIDQKVFGLSKFYLLPGIAEPSYTIGTFGGLYDSEGSVISTFSNRILTPRITYVESITGFWQRLFSAGQTAAFSIIGGAMGSEVSQLIEEIETVQDLLDIGGQLTDWIHGKNILRRDRVFLEAGKEYQYRFRVNGSISSQIFGTGGVFVTYDTGILIKNLYADFMGKLSIAAVHEANAEKGAAVLIEGTVLRDNIGVENANFEIFEGSNKVGSGITSTNGGFSLLVHLPNRVGSIIYRINAEFEGTAASKEVIIVATNPVAGRDLAIEDLVTPASVPLNSTISVNGTIRNRGSVETGGTLHTIITDPNGNTYTANVHSLNILQPDQTTSHSLDVSVQETGLYRVRWRLETEGGDANPSNNFRESGVWVGSVDLIQSYAMTDWMPPMDSRSRTFGGTTVYWEFVSSGVAKIQIRGNDYYLSPGKYYSFENGLLVIYYESYGNIPSSYSFFRVGYPQNVSSIETLPAGQTVMQGQTASYRFTDNSGDRVRHRSMQTVTDIGSGTIINNISNAGRDGNDAIYRVDSSTLSPGDYMWWVHVNIANQPEVLQRLNLTVNPGRDVSVSIPEILDIAKGQQLDLPVILNSGPQVTETGTVNATLLSPDGQTIHLEPQVLSFTGTETFNPWTLDTGHMVSGEYALTVEMPIPNDLNPGNNTATGTFTIHGSPEVSVGGFSVLSNFPSFAPREPVSVKAVVTSSTGIPLDNATVILFAVNPDGETESMAMGFNQEEELFMAVYVPKSVGVHSFEVLAFHAEYEPAVALQNKNINVTNQGPVLDFIRAPSEEMWTSSSEQFFEWIGMIRNLNGEKVLFSHKLNESEWSPYSETSSLSVTGFQQGENIFSIRAFDGEMEGPQIISHRFFFDGEKPRIDNIKIDGLLQEEGSGAISTSRQQVVLSGSAVDQYSGIRSTLIEPEIANDGTPEQWEFTADLNYGLNSFDVIAVDNAGNAVSWNISFERLTDLPVMNQPTAVQITEPESFHEFKLLFEDPAGRSTTELTEMLTTALRVNEPDGKSLQSLVSIIEDPDQNGVFQVKVEVSAPSGAWRSSDNGVYTIFFDRELLLNDEEANIEELIFDAFIVNIPVVSVEDWLHSIDGQSSGLLDRIEDSDISNLARYAFGLEPNQKMETAEIESRICEDRRLVIEFDRNPNAFGIQYHIEVSSDLDNWQRVATAQDSEPFVVQPVGVGHQIFEKPGDGMLLRTKVECPGPTSKSKFYRLKFSLSSDN